MYLVFDLYFYSPDRTHLCREAVYRWLGWAIVYLGVSLEKCSRCNASSIEALSRLVDAWFAGVSIPAATCSFHYQKRTRDRRWHSRILDIRSFRGDDCDTDHHLVVAKVRERLAVDKEAAQNFDVERFKSQDIT